MAQNSSLENRFKEAMNYAYNDSVKDMNKAFTIFKELSDKGYDKASAHLAWIYLYGNEVVEPDTMKAVSLMKKTADKGYVEAIESYAGFLLEGIGCKPDTVASVRYDKIGAEKGYDLSMHNYAIALMNGYGGLKPDTISAIGWFRKAAEKDLGSSQWMLARYYSEKYNNEEAKYWLNRGVKNGDRDCIHGMGLSYKYGICGFEKNESEAMKYFERAGAMGLEVAYMELADIYSKQGNQSKAREIYKKLADQGNMKALLRYGESFIDIDDKKVFEIYRQIVDTPIETVRKDQLSEFSRIFPWADLKIGMCYYAGVGVAQDKAKGAQIIYYYADKGFPRAIDAVRQLNIPRP